MKEAELIKKAQKIICSLRAFNTCDLFSIEMSNGSYYIIINRYNSKTGIVNKKDFLKISQSENISQSIVLNEIYLENM